ncbi:MAG: tripartite tricarboxylate transporter substrate binding protein [Betaproteobacteria bacterium]|nr:tripartite tricarboxylate transporter substrate binding protein [Betaproteobacteria bacterium]
MAGFIKNEVTYEGRKTMKFLCALAIGAAVLAAPCAASAQTYPDRLVHIILTVGPGGGTDILARLIATKLSTTWMQSVVVENKIGGQGSIAGKYVARSNPDGYTILLAAAGNITISPLLSDLGYDPMKDLLPVTILASAPYVFVVHPSLPVRSVKELIALAKAQPGKISWGSSTIGSPDHLAGELFQLMTGSRVTHIPYKGAGQTIVDLLGGHIDVSFMTIPPTLQYIRSGRIRALGVSDTARSPLLPTVPTIDEAGVTGYSMQVWYGMFVAPGTPRPIIQKIAEDSANALKQDDVRKKLTDAGFNPKELLPPAEVVAFIKAEGVKYGKVLDATGLRKKNKP